MSLLLMDHLLFGLLLSALLAIVMKKHGSFLNFKLLLLNLVNLFLIYKLLFLVFNMFITRNSQRIEVEQLKHCFTSTGYRIYCFRNLSPSAAVNRYIVAVRNVHDETQDFVYCLNMRQAFMYYLDCICCYA